MNTILKCLSIIVGENVEIYTSEMAGNASGFSQTVVWSGRQLNLGNLFTIVGEIFEIYTSQMAGNALN